MKNFTKWFGIVALVAAIGFSMAACDDGSGGPGGGGSSGGGGGTFTITDIPSKYNGKYVMFSGHNSDDVVLYNYEAGKGTTLARISNGRVSMPLWKLNTDGKMTRYSGNDTCELIGFITTDSTTSVGGLAGSSTSPDAAILVRSVTFSNGSATKSWNELDVNEVN
jgi:hypothetical protein